MLFAHGFGCDQHMWRHVAPQFEDRYQVVLFDDVGVAGPTRRRTTRSATPLGGYAEDVLAIVEELDLHDVVFVGHSVSAMIGVLAANLAAERFAHLVLVGPSPRYIDDPETGYVGGFARTDIDELPESLGSNYLGWSTAMAPAIIGNPDRPELGPSSPRASAAPTRTSSGASRRRPSCPTTAATWRRCGCRAWSCSAATTSSPRPRSGATCTTSCRRASSSCCAPPGTAPT